MQTFKLLIVCMLCNLCSFGQMQIMWDKPITDTLALSQYQYTIIACGTDTNNNIYAASYQLGTFDTLIHVQRRDASGNLIWQNTIPDNTLNASNDGNWYLGNATIFSDYQQNIYFITQCSVADIGLTNEYDYFWAKMDMNGNLISQKLISSGSSSNGYHPIDHDDSGNIYYIMLGTPDNEIGVGKIDPAGNIVYNPTYTIPVGDYYFDGAQVKVKGNKVFLSTSTSTPGVPSDLGYVVTYCLNAANGSLLWEYHDNTDTVALGGMVVGDNYVFVSTHFVIRVIDMNGNLAGSINTSTINTNWLWPHGINAYGEVITKENYPLTMAYAGGRIVKRDNSGNTLATTEYVQCTNWNDPRRIIVSDTNTVIYDVSCRQTGFQDENVPILRRYNNSLNAVDSAAIDSIPGRLRVPLFAILDHDKKIIACMGNICVNSIQCNPGVFWSLVKIDDPVLSLPFMQTPTSIEEQLIANLSRLNSYPNPASDGFINLEWQLANNTGMSVKIIDILGKIVWSGKTTDGKMKIDLKTLVKGTYYIQVNNGSQSQSARFVY